MVDGIADLECVSKNQSFPLYWCEKIERKAQQTFDFMSGDDECVRHDCISDFILKQFRQAIGPKANKEDIFYDRRQLDADARRHSREGA